MPSKAQRAGALPTTRDKSFRSIEDMLPGTVTLAGQAWTIRLDSSPITVDGQTTCIKAAFAADPYARHWIEPLEQLVGDTPPMLWLAAAVCCFTRFGPDEQQEDVLKVLCKSAGQPFTFGR